MFFSALSIKSRLYIISALSLATLVVLLGVSVSGHRSNQETFAQSDLFSHISSSVHVTLRGINETLLTEGSSASRKLVADGIKAMSESVSALKSRNLGDAERALLEGKLDPVFAGFAQEISRFQGIKDPSPGNDDALILLGKVSSLGEEVFKELAGFNNAMLAAKAEREKRFMLAGGLAAAIFLASLIFTVITQRSVTRSISGISDLQTVMRKVRSEGDLTARASGGRHDEIGAAADDLNALLENFQGIVHKMHENAKRVLNSASELSTVSRQVRSASAEQQTAALTTRQAMRDIAGSLERVTGIVTDTDATSRHASDLATRGKQDAQLSMQEMSRIAESVSGLSGQVSMLSQRSNEISNIVGVIKEIAEQTNLLALNAAIEAARAGEQGRGFAVVADEVRKLAERTTSATSDIGNIIGTIQNEMSTAVSSMSVAHGQVEQGSDRITHVGTSLAEIAEGASRTSRSVTTISDATREQSTVVGQVVANVDSISQMAENNSAAIESVFNAADALEKLAAQMRDYLDRFKS